LITLLYELHYITSKIIIDTIQRNYFIHIARFFFFFFFWGFFFILLRFTFFWFLKFNFHSKNSAFCDTILRNTFTLDYYNNWMALSGFPGNPIHDFYLDLSRTVILTILLNHSTADNRQRKPGFKCKSAPWMIFT
jgi:hypothetical protein